MIQPIHAMETGIAGPAKTKTKGAEQPSEPLDAAFEALDATLERKLKAAALSEQEAREARMRLGESISAAHALDPDRVAALIADPD